jgi:hypothetical protein
MSTDISDEGATKTGVPYSETTVNFYRTTRRHTSLYSHRCEKLKFNPDWTKRNVVEMSAMDQESVTTAAPFASCEPGTDFLFYLAAVIRLCREAEAKRADKSVLTPCIREPGPTEQNTQDARCNSCSPSQQAITFLLHDGLAHVTHSFRAAFCCWYRDRK